MSRIAFGCYRLANRLKTLPHSTTIPFVSAEGFRGRGEVSAPCPPFRDERKTLVRDGKEEEETLFGQGARPGCGGLRRRDCRQFCPIVAYKPDNRPLVSAPAFLLLPTVHLHDRRCVHFLAVLAPFGPGQWRELERWRSACGRLYQLSLGGDSRDSASPPYRPCHCREASGHSERRHGCAAAQMDCRSPVRQRPGGGDSGPYVCRFSCSGPPQRERSGDNAPVLSHVALRLDSQQEAG